MLRLDACNLCPRLCGANRAEGERGVCGAAGQLIVARAALHFWEEPPLSGEAGSGAVFFGGCPLHCVYCQNSVIAGGEVGQVIDVGRLAQICLELQEQGALNVNFVTPTHFSLHVRDAVRRAQARGLSIPIVWNTSGYERVETVRALDGTVDVYLDDFKYADSVLAERYSRAPDYPEVALAALAEMLRQVGAPVFEDLPGEGGVQRMKRGVIVRHMLLPGALDASKRALRVLHERFGDDVLYSIMNQYTPVMRAAALGRFPELGRAVAAEEYDELLDYADSLGMDDYFWQDGPADAESFIPSWNGEGVLSRDAR